MFDFLTKLIQPLNYILKGFMVFRKGFSLIEMAIILIMVSIIAGGVLTLLPKNSDKNLQDVMASKMDRIQDAILAYTHENGMLPCPADITTAVSTAAFGIAAGNCNTSIAGDIAVGSFGLRMGMIPVRTLGLSDDYAFDSWGNRIRYGVIRQLAVNSTDFENFATTYSGLSPNTRTFEIRDVSGNPINSPNSYAAPTANNSVAYILLSHGANGNGAVPFAGGASPACPASGLLDQENCNGDRIFRDVSFNTSSVNYFDDFIRWKTYNQLRIEAGVAKSVAQDPPILADVALIEYISNCNPSCLSSEGMGNYMGYGNGNPLRRLYNAVHSNFLVDPLVQTSPSSGTFTLKPGKYSFVSRNYYNTTIATQFICSIRNYTSGVTIGSALQDLAANTEGYLVVTSAQTITQDSLFATECSFNPYTHGSTTFRKFGSTISGYEILITRHRSE